MTQQLSLIRERDEDQYVRTVLERYRTTPTTAAK